MKSCLVTGGAGFIGSHLAHALVERGCAVRVLDNLSTGSLDNLAGVLSQRLVAGRDGSLLPAYELMISTPHIRELLEEGQTTEMARVIEGGTEAGLISFNECLRGLVERQEIELSEALAASDRPDELLLALRGIRGSADRVAGPTQGGGTPPPQPRGGDEPDGLRLARG